MTETEYQMLMDEIQELLHCRWYLDPSSAMISCLVRQVGKDNIPCYPACTFVGNGHGKKLYRKNDKIVMEDYHYLRGYYPRQILFDDGRATGAERGSLGDLL